MGDEGGRGVGEGGEVRERFLHFGRLGGEGEGGMGRSHSFAGE